MFVAGYIYESNKKLTYPPDLDDVSVHPAKIGFHFFESRDAKTEESLQHIFLYMPEQVETRSTVNWGETDIGFVATQAIAAGKKAYGAGAQGVKSVMSSLGSSMANAAPDAMGLVAAYGLSNLGAYVTNALGNAVGVPSNLTGQDALALVGNVAPNPYVTTLFKSISLREFQMRFTFYPFSEKDCDVIKNIISSFREHYLPGQSSGLGDGNTNAMLSLPHYADISYFQEDKENEQIPKYKRAAMTYLDVDYTGQGLFAQMRNGFPAEITMDTKQQELQIVTREDIKDNY